MQKIVVSSNNKNKIIEISDLLGDVEVLSLSDFSLESPPETGSTFEENSLIKSKYVFEKTGLPSIADDSGFCVDCFGGFPGLYSARFAESVGAFEHAFKVINECINPLNKKIYFICCVSFVFKNIEKTFVGRVDGNFVYPPIGNNGFGYDPVFMPLGYEHTFAEMQLIEKQKISHRKIAMENFLNFYNAEKHNFY
jgi:XTP/dITP diphosphohydrolase